MEKISVVIITFNEARNIARCLDSVRDIADDIVVVDSFSTDQTKEICKLKGVRFIEHAFAGHIEQKNWAISQAKYPFVLSLDADEALDATLRESIREAKKNPLFDGYYINRLTNYCGKWIKHCGWYPDKKLRLWNSNKGKWDGTNPHDRFVMDKTAKTGFLKGDILHYSYYTLNDHLKQINYFSDINALEAFKKGKKAGILKIIFSPIIKFKRDYFLKLGFLDGYHGFIISAVSAFASFMKYAKLRELHKNSKS